MMEEDNIEQVILVDENDRELGHMEKLAAHRSGLLHRAFSVFIFNSKGQLMLQKRAAGKYHSANLWSNTCCGHPRPGEELASAARRRLNEEMGLDLDLSQAFSFTYQAELNDGLSEHELDHVLIGFSDQEPLLSPEEASAKWLVDRRELEAELRDHPERFTAWFPLCVEQAWQYSFRATERT